MAFSNICSVHIQLFCCTQLDRPFIIEPATLLGFPQLNGETHRAEQWAPAQAVANGRWKLIEQLSLTEGLVSGGD